MAQSVVDIHESEWCRWLFEQPFSPQLSAKLKLPIPGRIFFQVPTVDLAPSARGPGDVDILAADARRGESAVAIEVKRIKVSAATFRHQAPNKLTEAAEKGVIQSNLLGRIGFRYTWLLVLVATDGRAQPGGNFFSRGITSELMDLICREPGFMQLDPHIGLLFVFVDQPVDKEISLAGGIGLHVEREAVSKSQSIGVTVALHRMLSTEPAPLV